MTLKYKNGIELIPIAAIPIPENQVKPGYLICCRKGMEGRFSFSVPELIECGNPRELIEGYVKNLEENFQQWLEKQTSDYGTHSNKKPYAFETGDLPPKGYNVDDPDLPYINDFYPDTRKESDYLSYGDDEPIRRPHHSSRRNKA